MPLAFAVWLGITQALPKFRVPAPQYDALYLTNYAGGAINTLRVDVLNNRLRAMFIGENIGYGWPNLYRFHAATGQVETIPIPRPNDLPLVHPDNRPMEEIAEASQHAVPIPDSEGFKVDPAVHSPDGYLFRIGDNHTSSLFAWEGKNDGFAYISHGPSQIAIPRPPEKGAVPVFLGWVIP